MALTLSLVINQDSQNTKYNYSTVTVDVILTWTTRSYNRTSPAPTGIVTINGANYPFSSTFNELESTNGHQTLHRQTVNVYHDQDGTKKVSASAKFITGIREGTIVADPVSKTLTRIPRAATITSAHDFNDEENPKITYSNPAGTAVTTLQAAIYSDDGSTVYADYRNIDKSGTEYPFSLTTEERTTLRNAARYTNSLPVKFYLKTVLSGTPYTSIVPKTLNIVNADPIVGPIISVDLDTQRLTGDEFKLIKYVSNASVMFAATAYKGANITSKLATCGGKSLTEDGTFIAVEDGKFVFTVKDSRGNSDTETINLPIVDYVKLTSSLHDTEFSTDGVIRFTLKGNYFNGSFGATDNTLTVQYRCKTYSGVYTPWAVISGPNSGITYNGNTYTYDVSISGLDYKETYIIQARVVDKIATVYTEEKAMSCVPVFDWSDADFNFNVPVTIKGASVPSIIDQGTSGIWTYVKWSDGTSECWGKQDVSVTFQGTSSLPNWGGLYTTGAIIDSNVSFPSNLFVETPVITASLLVRSVGGILMAPGGSSGSMASKNSTGVYEIARGTYISGSQAYTINYVVKGSWKENWILQQ